jgi:hypothetical protein
MPYDAKGPDSAAERRETAAELRHPAHLITEPPASEAIAERCVSALTAVFDTRRECTGIDLKSDSMRIRIVQTNHREQFDFVASAAA